MPPTSPPEAGPPSSSSISIPSSSRSPKPASASSAPPIGKAVLIDALSLDFKDIEDIARAIKLDDPAFPDGDYRHPATSVETPVTTHADSLLRLLEDQAADTPAQLSAKAALRTKFLAYEIAADFVEDLRADRDALDACNSGKHSDKLAAWKSATRRLIP